MHFLKNIVYHNGTISMIDFEYSTVDDKPSFLENRICYKRGGKNSPGKFLVIREIRILSWNFEIFIFNFCWWCRPFRFHGFEKISNNLGFRFLVFGCLILGFRSRFSGAIFRFRVQSARFHIFRYGFWSLVLYFNIYLTFQRQNAKIHFQINSIKLS